jgi:hypothetical protein
MRRMDEIEHLAVQLSRDGLVEPALQSGMIVPLLTLQRCGRKELLDGSLFAHVSDLLKCGF